MAQDLSTVYAGIVKFDEQPDGTVIAYGKATDSTLDSDEQICDQEWLKQAMPQWFKYGNIREQHSNIAAGVATEYQAKDDGHYITAHIVDASSAKKVKTGVLKGFSIGIRGARVVKDNKAAGGRIVDGQIVEVSVVDRPANPSCMLTVAKANKSGSLRKVAKPVLKEFSVDAVEEKSASALIAKAREIAGDVTKFDQASFDMARRGLAGLLVVEANELAEGNDESDSIACLLTAIHALFEFHEGEAMEGEVESINGGDTDTDIDNELNIELAEAQVCPDCGKNPCQCGDEMDKEGDKKPAEQPASESAAPIADEDEPSGPDTDEDDDDKMCKSCGKSMKMCKCAEGGYSAEAKSFTLDDIRSIVMDVVKTLDTNPKVGDPEPTESADSERIKALEAELEKVMAAAAPSGPKRFATVAGTARQDERIALAKAYRAKAGMTLDRALSQGYLEKARDIENSINKSEE